jgi:hypothetical protein
MSSFRVACPFRYFILVVVFLSVFPAVNFLSAQEDKYIPTKAGLNWSEVPTLDGRLEDAEWLPINDPSVNGYDNVKFIYDAQTEDPPKSFGKMDPPGIALGYVEDGGPYDPPLSWFVVNSNFDGFPSGFNLIAMGVQWHLDGLGSADYYIALDLPGSTNLAISDDILNPYNGKYAIAFDADANEDASLYDTSLIDHSNFSDGSSTEFYLIFLWLGPTERSMNFVPIRGGYRTLTDGLPLEIKLNSKDGSDKLSSIEISARIPGSFEGVQYTNSGDDIDIGSLISFGGIPSIPLHPPDPDNAVLDIELRIADIKFILDQDIKWESVGATIGDTPLSLNDCSRVFAENSCGLVTDFSEEESFGHWLKLPILPVDVDVEKTVGCGDCNQAPPQLKKKTYAIPDSVVRFELDIELPLVPTTSIPNPPDVNGAGWVVAKDKLFDDQGIVEWVKLCEDEITVNGEYDKVWIPEFNVTDEQWVAKIKDKDENYIFNPGDVLIVPFEVKIKDGYDKHEIEDEIINQIEVWGENEDFSPGPDNPYEAGLSYARVDVLVPESNCEKAVHVIDDAGKEWWSIDFGVSPPEFLAELLIEDPESADIVWPIVVTWWLNVSNADSHEYDPDAIDGETYLKLTALEDPVLKSLGWPGVTVPIEIEPGEHLYFDFSREFTDWNDWYEDSGKDYEIDNDFTATMNVLVKDPRPEIGTICVIKEYPSTFSNQYDQSCGSKVKLGIYPPPACVAIAKEVSCNENGPWYESVDALPSSDLYDTEIWFRITVWNKSTTIPIDHAYVTDTLTGPITLVTLPPDGDIGDLPTGDGNPGGPDTKVYKFYGIVNKVTSSGVEKDIINHVLVEADGPDPGDEPDNGPESSAEDEAWANIRIPDLELRKTVYVEDSGGWTSGSHASEVFLPPDVKWPIKVDYCVEARVPSAGIDKDGLDVTSAELSDELLEKIDTLVADAVDFDPHAPPIAFFADYEAPWKEVLEYCKFEIKDFDEFKYVAENDEDTSTELTIENESMANYNGFDIPDTQSSNDLCGQWSGDVDDMAKIHAYKEQKLVPALSTYGMIIMSLVMAGLIFLRMRRGM